MKREKRSGFTLVEVLTVIAIIALLAGLILGLAGNAQKTAGRKKAEAEVTQLETFVTEYQMKYGKVPADRDALKEALVAANHPLTNMLDPWGIEYEYEKSSDVTFYLWSTGGATNDNREIYIGNPEP